MSIADISKQTSTTYLSYNKIKAFEDVGFFLKNYVVRGGEVSKNIKHNDTIDVSGIVVVIGDDVVQRDGTSLKVETPDTVCYLDFTTKGDFSFGTVQSGISGTDFIPVAEVTTDSFGNVSTIIDRADPRGGFRLKPGTNISGTHIDGGTF